MQETIGFDAAVSTMLNGVVQQGLLPSGGALMADAFGVGSSTDVASNGAAATQSANGSDSSVGVPTMTGAVSDPIIAGDGIQTTCTDDDVAKKLQAGGEYWNHQGTSSSISRFESYQAAWSSL